MPGIRDFKAGKLSRSRMIRQPALPSDQAAVRLSEHAAAWHDNERLQDQGAGRTNEPVLGTPPTAADKMKK
jgi:hypothetical protein